MEGYRILCVDDDINMLNTVEDILINTGYSVSLAKSGKQALEYIKKGINYQLVLLDVDMPDMDGYIKRVVSGILEKTDMKKRADIRQFLKR
jgi:CheY-like chemotaxis protein